MKKVFLGGTVADSTWREYIIPKLEIEYFNPVVEDWNEEAYQQELYERENCDYCLYVLTPKLKGFYSIAEVIDDANDRPNKTLLCILTEDGDVKFSHHQLKSLNAVGKMVVGNGARWFTSLDDVVRFLNSSASDVEKAQARTMSAIKNAEKFKFIAEKCIGNIDRLKNPLLIESLGRELETAKMEFNIFLNDLK